MSRHVQTRAEVTHAQILQAAERCFARCGYEAASVAFICQEAGVTKGAFYYHFESKQALFLELLNAWLAGLDMQLKKARNTAASVPDGLREMTASSRAVFVEASAYLPMFLEFWLHALRDPQIWQLVIEPYRRYQEFFTALLSEGAAEGSLRIADAPLTARALLAMVIGLLLQAAVDPEGADWGKIAEDSVHLFISGLMDGP